MRASLEGRMDESVRRGGQVNEDVDVLELLGMGQDVLSFRPSLQQQPVGFAYESGSMAHETLASGSFAGGSTVSSAAMLEQRAGPEPDVDQYSLDRDTVVAIQKRAMKPAARTKA
jgi:hypothetical protein